MTAESPLERAETHDQHERRSSKCDDAGEPLRTRVLKRVVGEDHDQQGDRRDSAEPEQNDPDQIISTEHGCIPPVRSLPDVRMRQS